MGVGHGLAAGELYSIAQSLSWRYRHVSEADLEDAVQAAVVAMVGALAQLREMPLDVRAYVRRVAYLALQLAVWTERSPVTIARDRLPQEAARTQRTDADVALACAAVPDAPVDERLAADRWSRSVRRRLREVIGNDAADDREVAQLVLLEDHRPAEAAQAVGRSVAEVYVVTQRIKNRILKDARMRELWRDMPSRVEVSDGHEGSDRS